MKYDNLLAASKANLDKKPLALHCVFSLKIFDHGAQWMFSKLNENNPDKCLPFNPSVHYTGYGVLKYGISFTVLLLAVYVISGIHLGLLPLSIFFFYFAEIHFLFIFPLLLDRCPNPIWNSIKLPYKMGIFSLIITVIPIGFFMIMGLFDVKNPLRNWYIGCNSILIWYQHEIRNRI